MKKFILFLILTGLPLVSYSQMFQKITNQPLVTENGYGSGCAWGDYNNDGKLDMIVTSYNDFGATTYPLLYKNMGNGNFQLASDNTIMTNSLNQTLACAWGDYNYDGRMDLYIATGLNQPDLLYKNMGGGNFTRITNCVPLVNGHSGGVNWTDYNKDGFLDILSVQHGYNLLYKGLPNGDFAQVTTGPVVTDYGNHRRACWGDYNNDRYPDLFVANGNFENDNLYLNNKNGTFTKINTGAIVTDSAYGSGCSWGDYNNDGWLDLFVTSSGKNILYKNNKNGSFTKITAPFTANGISSFGCNWGDYDNDGDLDLFVANNYNAVNFLYRNEGNDNFTKITNEIVGNEPSSSVGSAWGDYNNDGKLDLFVVNQGYNGPSENDFLYKNTGASNWYLTIKFWGGGIGTRVKIRIGNYIAIREVSGGNSCSSQDMPWVHFGLGFLANNPVSAADSVIVDWHDGTKEVLTNVTLNQELDFFGVVPVQQISSEVPNEYSLDQNYPNPFNPATTINYSIVNAGEIKITLFDVSGKEVDVLVNGIQSPGKYSINYNASRLPSGVYFYRINTEGFTDTRKMILIK